MAQASEPQNDFRAKLVALIEDGRLELAEPCVKEALERFPDQPWPMVAVARLALKRGECEEAIRQAALARTRFPDHPGGWSVGVEALREAGRSEEAESLLHEALERFPADPWLTLTAARMALARGVWSEAVRRVQAVRARFPNFPGGYALGAEILSETGRLEEAEAVIEAAIARFPAEPWPLAKAARLALRRSEWERAIKLAARLKARFPAHPGGYILAIEALRGAGHADEAEAMAAAATARFPSEVWPLATAAQLAEACRDATEADRRWQQALERFPDNAAVAFGFALVPLTTFKNAEEGRAAALSRLADLRRRFPNFAKAASEELRLLRETGRLAEARAAASTAIAALPQTPGLATEAARIARAAGDQEEAIALLEETAKRFPEQLRPRLDLASALAEQGRFAEAERQCRAALASFPLDPRPHRELARLAVRQADWPTALKRWRAAAERFPDDPDIRRGTFEARLALVGKQKKPGATPSGEGADGPPLQPAKSVGAKAEMIVRFESLGGTGVGCEFGLVQRELGAEPLGLLRWSRIRVGPLVSALEQRFAGVGTEKQTRLARSGYGGDDPEYVTSDTRFQMTVHNFVRQSHVSEREMFEQTCRRLRFLKRKFIEDLKAGEKIFVYKLGDDRIGAEEIERLHAALCRYAANTLLCVRLADAGHADKMVETVQPGLLIGYVKHFGTEPRGREKRRLALDSWIAVCAETERLRRISSPLSLR